MPFLQQLSEAVPTQLPSCRVGFLAMFPLMFSRDHAGTLGLTLTSCQKKPSLRVVGRVFGVVGRVRDRSGGQAFVFDFFCVCLFVLKWSSQLAPKMSLSDSGDWGLEISQAS